MIAVDEFEMTHSQDGIALDWYAMHDSSTTSLLSADNASRVYDKEVQQEDVHTILQKMYVSTMHSKT